MITILNTAFTFTMYRLVFSGTWWSNSISQKHNHQLLMFERNWNNILFLSMIFQGHFNENSYRLSIDRMYDCPKISLFCFTPIIDSTKQQYDIVEQTVCNCKMAFTMKLSKGFLQDINYDIKPNTYIFAHTGFSRRKNWNVSSENA